MGYLLDLTNYLLFKSGLEQFLREFVAVFAKAIRFQISAEDSPKVVFNSIYWRRSYAFPVSSAGALTELWVFSRLASFAIS